MLKTDQIIPYSALYIDMQYRNLFNTLWSYIKPFDQDKYIQQLKKQKILVTLCVSASIDLILQALNWPPGYEIIITGISIPEMVQVLRLNGLIPLPIEVDPHTLGCTLDKLKKFYSQRTKGIMISYVFGAKFDSSDIIDWAKSKGLFIMEDEAESFNAPNATLNPNVEFSTFSFSSIKTCSAFGGFISVIRNNEVLYSKMKAIQETYPKWSQRNQDINQNFQLFEENFKKFNPNDFVKQQNNKKKFKMDFQQFLSYQGLQRICSQQYSRIPKKLS